MHDLFCSNDAQVQPAEQHFEQSHAFLYFTDAVLLKVLQIKEIAFVCTSFFSSFLKSLLYLLTPG